MENFDFSGWATKVNLKCADGLTILKDAFKHNDGQTVPLVWNHQHNDPNEVLGHALLENRDEGVYAYCKFNDTENGKTAKLLVQHGDVNALSIYANQLKKQSSFVSHGNIREVSLVLAGANPGAFIDEVMKHSDDGESEAVIYTDEVIELEHSGLDGVEIAHAEEPKTDDESEKKEKTVKDVIDSMNEEQKTVFYGFVGALSSEDVDEKIQHSDDDSQKEGNAEKKDKTVKDVFDEMTEEQKTVVYAMVGAAVEEATGKKDNNENKENDSKGGTETMKHNVFDQDETVKTDVLSHADEMTIIELAKKPGVGSLKHAIEMFVEDNDSLKHGIFDDTEIEKLFPELQNINPGAPEILRQDQSWVMSVINKIHKSPFSRIKTRHADARVAELRAKGYQKKGDPKTLSNTITLLSRETTPQTVYRKDELHRDDIVDIKDFDIVAYQWKVMKENMYEELALAALVGDGRDDADPDKIHETHIRSIWNDDELYTIHRDVDVEAMRTKLQGTNTGANFGDNYIYAEATIEAALYAREQFKGTGTPDMYCNPHFVNIMLLARDLNGRRIYDSKADLAKALNVGAIHEIEQLGGKVRTTEAGEKKQLLGLFVNLADYTFGSTKGGEITKFEDFDIDFNKYKYLMEARLCGTLTKPYAAIALEEPVADEAAG